MKTKNIEPHPFCLIFPAMSGDEMDALIDDIRKHGQRVPIVLFEGKILDGRSRYQAALAAGVKPYFKPFDGSRKEALQYVASFNLHRRHLSPSQKAAAAYKYMHQLVDCGVPEKRAAKQAVKATNAKERYVESFAKIQESDPRVARKIELGSDTIGRFERDRAAPTAIQRVQSALRDAAADLRRAMTLAGNSEVSERTFYEIKGMADKAERLVESLQSRTPELV